MLRATARRVLPVGTRRALKRWLGLDYEVISGCEILLDDVHPKLLLGWKDRRVAERQDTAFAPVLQQMREGRPREDFTALAAALRLTAATDPLIVEVGCGSAWNAEVLTTLWSRPFRYVGMDYSPAMIARARRRDAERPYVVGDAAALPLRGRSCDILLSGTVLMHLLGYQAAIQESRRVSRRWCIFHTVPVVTKRPTTILKKFAYGSPVVEIVFNANEFPSLLRNSGLRLRDVLDSLPHDYLNGVLGEPITARTYVCEII
jgi:ubiquinone/menaquinone biosynthesis C-methylase UbiE